MNDANNAVTLLPCPFCKSRCVTATRDEHGWKVVECDDCGARGPCIDLEGDQYIDRWNLSTPNAPVEQREAIARLVDPCAWRTRDRQYASIERLTKLSDVDRAGARLSADAYAQDSLAKADAILAVRLDEAAIRKDEREKQRGIDAKICDQVRNNAERRAADHTNIDAIKSALDKMDGAVQCASAIRSHETPETPNGL